MSLVSSLNCIEFQITANQHIPVPPPLPVHRLSQLFEKAVKQRTHTSQSDLIRWDTQRRSNIRTHHYLHQAKQALRNQNYQQALEWMKAIDCEVDSLPDGTCVASWMSLEKHLILAKAFRGLKRYDEARTQVQEGLQLGTKYHTESLALGELCLLLIEENINKKDFFAAMNTANVALNMLTQEERSGYTHPDIILASVRIWFMENNYPKELVDILDTQDKESRIGIEKAYQQCYEKLTPIQKDMIQTENVNSRLYNAFELYASLQSKA